MSLVRSHDPGLLTLLGHGLATAVLAALWLATTLLRALLAPAAELAIRLNDLIADALAERLDR